MAQKLKLVAATKLALETSRCEETIAQNEVEQALRLAAYNYDRRLRALQSEMAVRERELQDAYLATVAQVVTEAGLPGN